MSLTLAALTQFLMNEDEKNTSLKQNNKKYYKQLDKSKKKVISERMDLLDKLMTLPSTKSVEMELRTKRWLKNREPKMKNFKNLLLLIAKSK